MSILKPPAASPAGVRPGRHAELVPASRFRRGAPSAAVQTAGFRPPELELGPLPGSKGLEALLARRAPTAAASDHNPGTPGDPTLFGTWPWSAMGKVSVGQLKSDGTVAWESVGSGCMVGRRLMLTASHVAPWDYINSGDWVMQFVPGYHHTPRLGVGSAWVASWYGTVDDTSEEGEMFGRDYVVCGLYEPMGDTVGWLPVTSMKESRYDDYTYTSTGYPTAVQDGQVPCIEGGLTIRDIDNGGTGGKQLETRHYGGPGWSGGPLWVLTGL